MDGVGFRDRVREDVVSSEDDNGLSVERRVGAVLLVDDDVVVRGVVREALRGLSAEVEILEAGDVVGALTHLASGRVGAMSTDLNLEDGGDGVEGLFLLAAAARRGVRYRALCSGTASPAVLSDPRVNDVMVMHKPDIVSPAKAWFTKVLEDL